MVQTALRQAGTFRDSDPTGVIIQADTGQHTSTQLADTAAELGVLLSVGRTGMCWDNAQPGGLEEACELVAVILVCVKAIEAVVDVLTGQQRLQSARPSWGYANPYEDQYP